VRRFLPELEDLASAFEDKGQEFDGILKAGRTHLQDATPVRLGQEFAAYGLTLRKCSGHLRIESISMAELGIGGTAVGTGLNTPPGFASAMVDELKKLTNIQELAPSLDMREAMQSQMALARTSGALRNLALELGRIANDLRLLSSGPTTGLAEIRLPDLQPGSSIMPGKVNPVMAECMNMVCFQVIGNDLTIAQAVNAGQMDLNVMMPVIIHNLLESLDIITNMCRAFRQRCVMGITADKERCNMYAAHSLGLATVLSTRLGYEETAKLVQEATRNKMSILELIRSRGLLSEKEMKELLDPYLITEPGILTRKK
jgi:aspartate ammonia-lyase